MTTAPRCRSPSWQQRLWFRIVHAGSPGKILIVLDLDGPLDRRALERALETTSTGTTRPEPSLDAKKFGTADSSHRLRLTFGFVHAAGGERFCWRNAWRRESAVRLAAGLLAPRSSGECDLSSDCRRSLHRVRRLVFGVFFRELAAIYCATSPLTGHRAPLPLNTSSSRTPA